MSGYWQEGSGETGQGPYLPPWGAAPPPGYGGPPQPPRPGHGQRFREGWRALPGLARVTVIVAAILIVLGGVTGGVLASSARTIRHALLPSSTGPATPSGFLYTNPDTTIFIQWTQNGENVSGTLEIAYLPTSDGTTVQTANDAVTGVIANGNVTLSLDASVLGTTNLSGTFDGQTLLLTVPQADGSLGQALFKPAQLSGYNESVSTLQNLAQQNLAAQEQAQAQAQAAAAQAAAEQKLSQQYDAVASDIQTVQQFSFSSDLSTLASDLQQQTGDRAKVATDAQTVANDSGQPSYQVCDDVVQADDDTVSVVDDSVSVGDDILSLEEDLRSLRQDVSELQQDWAAIAPLQQQVPGYVPGNAVSAEAVTSAVNQATQAEASVVATANQGAAQANATTSSAITATQQLAQSTGCAEPEQPPAPIAPIS